MGYFVSCMMVPELISRRSRKEMEKYRIQKKIDNLTQYVSSIGKQDFTIMDLLKVPVALVGRAMSYLGFAHNNSMLYVQQNAPYLMQFYGQQGGAQNPDQQVQMQRYINQQLYAQARQQAADIEKENMHQIEKQLEQEKENIDNDIKMIDKQLEYHRSTRDESLKNLLPTAKA